MNKRLEAVVHGRVQGVGFRYSTCERAQALELTGWVANQYDGTVRVVAEGPETVLTRFADWLHRGPAGAHVDFVDLRWFDAVGEFRHFGVRG
jgi:acylphosphatase